MKLSRYGKIRVKVCRVGRGDSDAIAKYSLQSIATHVTCFTGVGGRKLYIMLFFGSTKMGILKIKIKQKIL
jgi:hypothetical protein